MWKGQCYTVGVNKNVNHLPLRFNWFSNFVDAEQTSFLRWALREYLSLAKATRAPLRYGQLYCAIVKRREHFTMIKGHARSCRYHDIN